MTAARRRWWWAVAAAAVVALLVGGRWAAVEVAERLWAAGVPGANAYLDGRALARLFRGALLLLATAWATGNLYLVYRTIGSVQLPRRLGDLEIVEAISRRVLLGGTIASGVVFGVLLTWGTGEWWLAAALAADPPRFGVAEPILERDLGYYVSSLRWTAQLQNHALAAVAGVTALVTLLYIGIGVLAWRDGRLAVGPRARLHLAILLAGLGTVFLWGAILDPAEVVGGLHGPAPGPGLTVRLRGAGIVVGLAAAATVGSVIWGLTGRATLLAVTWGLLAVGAPLAYVIVPTAVRGRAAAARPVQNAEQPGRAFTERAFGLRQLPRDLPSFAAPATALVATPLWDDARVVMSVRRERVFGERATVGGIALLAASRPSWLVAPAPDDAALRDATPVPSWDDVHRGPWAVVGGPRVVSETDSGLGGAPAPLRDTVALFGPGFTQYAVLDSSTPGVRRTGMPLASLWHRAALAWTLQSTALLRRELADEVLLWRRDALERLERLAPFAAFDAPQPVIAGGALWWAAYGYVSSPSFPLVTPIRWRGRSVRYLRAGFVGLVAAADGATRVYLAPGYDSVAAAWQRAFVPLVAPPDSLPRGVRAALAPPVDAFEAALAATLRLEGDSGWVRRGSAPFQTIAPAADGSGRLARWRAQSAETGAPARLAALFAGTMTDAGPAYGLWRPSETFRTPPPVLGSSATKPGELRVWPVAGVPLGVQALFTEPLGGQAAALLDRVYVSWRGGVGEGPTAATAWADLQGADGDDSGGSPAQLDRVERARALLARADSALRAGDLERFARAYEELKRLLGVSRGLLAPPEPPE